MKFYSSYLQPIYDDPVKYKELISKTAARLRRLQKKTPFDAIAFRGTSGAALAYPISARMGIPLICVRKKGDNAHCCSTVEGSGLRDIKRYIIIDDFIFSGNTIDEILSEINREAGFDNGNNARSRKTDGADAFPDTIQCVAIVLYTASPYRNKAERFYRNIPLITVQKG